MAVDCVSACVVLLLLWLLWLLLVAFERGHHSQRSGASAPSAPLVNWVTSRYTCVLVMHYVSGGTSVCQLTRSIDSRVCGHASHLVVVTWVIASAP